MKTVKFHGRAGNKDLRGPDGALLDVGQVFQANKLWLMKHRAFVQRDELEVLGDKEEQSATTCSGVTAAGNACGAKPLDGSAFCRHHQGQAD